MEEVCFVVFILYFIIFVHIFNFVENIEKPSMMFSFDSYSIIFGLKYCNKTELRPRIACMVYS